MEKWIQLAAALWLIPCAWQDVRTRNVSNLLTVPFFLAAWPVAAWRGWNWLAFTFLTFLVSLYGWKAGWVGPADGKVLTGLSALIPASIPALFVVLLIAVAVRKALGRSGKEPGMVYFAIAGGIGALWVLTNREIASIMMVDQGFRV